MQNGDRASSRGQGRAAENRARGHENAVACGGPPARSERDHDCIDTGIRVEHSVECLGRASPLSQYGDDRLIAVGLRCSSAQLGRAMELFRNRGVSIAYVTDRSEVQTREFATCVFASQVRGTSLFDSCVGVISLLNSLATRTYHGSDRTAHERLNKLEGMLEALGELDPEA